MQSMKGSLLNYTSDSGSGSDTISVISDISAGSDSLEVDTDFDLS